MSEFLDELARTMARPMPRSRAVRVLGSALVTAAVPSSFRTAIAGASPRGSSACPPLPNCNSKPNTVFCGVVNRGNDGCTKYIYVCCPKGGGDPQPVCCKGDGEVQCCRPCEKCGEENLPLGGVNIICVEDPANPRSCGGTCCAEDEFCAHKFQELCCKRDQRVCGSRYCCKPEEECVTHRIPGHSQSFCIKRCPTGRAWCGTDKCCPPKWHCANPSKGICKRCRPTEEECEKKCCDRATSRCCGKAGCCPKSRSCCNTGKKQVCCPPRQKCRVPIQRGDIGVKPGTPAICCPPERVSTNPDLCCPPGQVALNSPGFRTPPPGMSPFCCPPGQICQSAIAGKVCADFQSDPRNCGGCGNVCESGICAGGVCALA